MRVIDSYLAPPARSKPHYLSDSDGAWARKAGQGRGSPACHAHSAGNRVMSGTERRNELKRQ